MRVVYLGDSDTTFDQADDYFKRAADWAKQQCPTFVSYHVQDVSDVSIQHDYIAEYRFRDSRDVMLFTLRWSP